jgi:UDP-N-acetylmuramate-alanine ligase
MATRFLQCRLVCESDVTTDISTVFCCTKPSKCICYIQNRRVFDHCNTFRHYCVIFRNFSHQVLNTARFETWCKNSVKMKKKCRNVLQWSKTVTFCMFYVHSVGMVQQNKLIERHRLHPFQNRKFYKFASLRDYHVYHIIVVKIEIGLWVTS